jgi:hypothetical protein
MSSPNNSRLSILWTKDLKGKDKEDLEATIRNSTVIREKLTQIIDDLIKNTTTTDVDFDNPNWAYRQANLIGQRKAYNEIRKLID